MLREYEPADLPQLLNVWAAATAVAHPFLDEEFLEQELDNIPNVYLPIAETWVWEIDGRVAGFLALIGNEVGAVFVHPNVHRRGIGSTLMDHALYLRGELEVDVFKQNNIGRAFYEKYGFEPLLEKVHEPTGNDVLRLRLSTP